MAENGYQGGRGFNSRYSRSELLLGLAQTMGGKTEETLKELHEQDVLWEDKEDEQNGFESKLFGRMHWRKSSWSNTYAFVDGGKRFSASAPVNVPNWPRITKISKSLSDDEDEMVVRPPHEFIAHYNNNNYSDKSFSVVAGFHGRTLKGRDLRKLRDAVFRQTGFLD